VNDVKLLGRLGKDLELTTSDKGVKYCFGSIAVDASYVDKSGAKIDATDWIPFTLYDKQAENAVKYVGKGCRVILTGKLTTKKTETDKYPIVVFKALHMEFVDFKAKDAVATPAADTVPF
jgi:single-strand DNA-binding protein